MFFAFCAAPSFSLPRKKQRGPEGGQTSTWGLPFNVYPSLSPKVKSPLGTRAAQTPLDSPRTHNAGSVQSCLPHMGLAGAYRSSMIPLLVGATLPCTASRRCRYYALVWTQDTVSKPPSRGRWLREALPNEDGGSMYAKAAPRIGMQPSILLCNTTQLFRPRHEGAEVVVRKRRNTHAIGL